MRFVLLLFVLLLSNEIVMAEDMRRNDTMPGFTGGPSLDTTPVDIEMNGTHWRIPRNYLETARLYKRYLDIKNYVDAATLIIVITYPEFTGATPETIHCYKVLGRCANTIKLGELRIDENVKKRNEPAIEEAARTRTVDKYGLTKMNAKTSLVPDDAFVFYGGSYETSVVISCSPENSDEARKYCSVFFELFKTAFLYEYDLKMLPHWREVHDNITRLLMSFHLGEVQ
jgi:hypothetical protein